LDTVFIFGSTYEHIGDGPTTGVSPTQGASNATWQLAAAGAPDLTTRGAILIKGETATEELVPDTAGKVLTDNGPGEDPSYQVAGLHAVALTNGRTGAYRSGAAIMSDKTIRMWGSSSTYQLGIGTNYTGHKNKPVVCRLPDDAYTHGVRKFVRSMYSNLLVLNNGDVYSWGAGGHGQLGHDSTADIHVPTKIAALNGLNVVDAFLSIRGHYASMSALFLADDGTAYYCGAGGSPLGSGSQVNSPTALTKTDWAKLFSSQGYTGGFAGIDTSGNLYTCGYNTTGEAGHGTTGVNYTPTQVTLPDTVQDVSINIDDYTPYYGHMVILLTDGRVFTCGDNGYGQLGDGTNNVRHSPIEITSLGTDNVEVHALGGPYGITIVKKTDGSIRVFGYNGYAICGDGTTTNRSTPVTPSNLSMYGTVTKILPYGSYTTWGVALLMSSGKVIVGGYNGNGERGGGSTDTAYPTYLEFEVGNKTITDISCAGYQSETGILAITSDGQLFQSGYGGDYMNGDVEANYAATPSPIIFT
jgi:alpha-tubulin suppressor-like RCC1 family protein